MKNHHVELIYPHGMKFTKHSWNAFKAFIDSHIAKLP
jgi:hypothetical protein